MSQGMLFSLTINILVGLYFALWYPRSLEKNFRGRTPPPLFALLGRVLPPVGWILVLLSLGFGAYQLITRGAG